MKSGLVLLLVFFSLLLVSGCKDAKTGIVIPENVGKYPIALNTEWEYETINYVAKYDKNGNLGVDSVLQPISYATVKITSVTDNINEEKGLIRFDCLSTLDSSKSSRWYRNSDSAFQMIWTSGFERDWVTPKMRNSKGFTFRNYLSKNLFPACLLLSAKDAFSSNNLVVYKYPFAIGNSWEIYPGAEGTSKRIILEKKHLSFKDNYFECFDIKLVNESLHGIEYHDYISLELGLVKREITIDSAAFTVPDSPDILFYGKFRTTSTLTRKSN